MFLLRPTYFSGADNNWRLSRWPPWVLMEMSKMWKVTDGHTDEGRAMVNRPWHKLIWSKAPGELTIEDLQDGCCGGHRGYRNKMNLHVMSRQCLPPSFGSIWLTKWEQMRFKFFKMATLGPSQILDQNYFSNSEYLCHSMPPIRFGLNSHYGMGGNDFMIASIQGFDSIRVTVREQTLFGDFQDGHHGGLLDIRTERF